MTSASSASQSRNAGRPERSGISEASSSIAPPRNPLPLSGGSLGAPGPSGREETTATQDGCRRRGPWVFMATLLLFTAIPLAWMVSTSFKGQFAALQQPPQGSPATPTLTSTAPSLTPAAKSGRSSCTTCSTASGYSTATTVLGVAVAVPAAYAFSRFSFPGRDMLFFSVLVRNMFPALVFRLPSLVLMRKVNLVNSHWALIITYLTFGLPLSIWLLKGFFDNIPVELEQAARIDGASRFQAFRLIVMPLSSPGIIATAIYAFIQAWNEYVYALTFLNQDRLLTLPVGLQRFFTEYSTNWPGLMAAALIMSVPVVSLPRPPEILRPAPYGGGGEDMRLT